VKVAGWAVIVFFGAGAIVSMVVLWPGRFNLTLDQDGFTVSGMWRRSRHRWADVSGFKAARIHYPGGETEMIVFDDCAARGYMLAAVNVKLVGRNSGLPDSYGFDPDALAHLMSQWRERALKR
jgi:hypothetical protein